MNIQKKINDANVVNAFLSRMQQPQVEVSDMPSGSRFTPWLSDKLEASKAELASLEEAEKEVKIQQHYKEKKAELQALADKYGIEL